VAYLFIKYSELTFPNSVTIFSMIIETPEQKAQIAEVLREFPKIDFQTELTPAEKDIARKNALSGGKTPNVVFFRGKFVVRYYLAGAQRTFGFFTDYTIAGRLADLVIVFFNARRTRHRRILTDDDLNLTLSRATADRANEHEFLSMLCRVDSLLPDKVSAPRPSRKGEVHKTVSAAVARLENEIILLRKELREALAWRSDGPPIFVPTLSHKPDLCENKGSESNPEYGNTIFT
jgi:hypothetical protein